MHVLIAPDSFKESMTAAQAAAAIKRGVMRALPQAECVLRPLADGGEGTLAVMAQAMGAELRAVLTTDPLGRTRTAHFGLAGSTAIIEVAEVIGLGLIAPAEREIMRATTTGLAAVFTAALDAGATRLIVGVGGTATCDGGAGLLAGLGARLLDDAGQDVPADPGGLTRLARVELAGLDPRLGQVSVEVATDVTNPLLGVTGAAAVFAPQKGARPEQLPLLEAGLARWADALVQAGTPPLAEVPGAGAAGGLGAALLALGAQLRSGAELISEAVDLPAAIAAADLVITGEGALDAQTMSGKTIAAVVSAAAVQHVPVWAFAGRVAPLDWSGWGLARAVAISPDDLPVAEALAAGERLLADAVAGALDGVQVGCRHA